MNLAKVLALGTGFTALALCMAPDARCDAPAWMHAAANVSLPTYDEKTDAVLVYAEDITTVMADGRTKGIERRAYKILRPDGRRYAVAEAYVEHDTKVGAMRAWCIPRQGKDYEVKDKDAVEKSPAFLEGDEISDLKARILQIPAGDVGNVVGYEIQYDARPFVLDDQWEFQREIPVKEFRYTLQMPNGWEYKSVWMNHAKVEPVASGGNQWQWVVTDVPEIRKERSMPPWGGLAGRMLVAFLAPGARPQNGFLTWDDMAKWQNGLTSGRREATPEISKKFAEITADQTTPQLKMAQIARFMQKDIRYVAIEIGIGGWQPHPAGEVFIHRYGDCKDKVTLMSTLLKLAGVDSYYLFINTRRGAVGPDTPPERMFDHAILAIKLPEGVKDAKYQSVFSHPKLGNLLIFDPTDEKTPLGKLNGELQANYAFLVTPEGGELIQTPQLPTASNGVVRKGKFTLDGQGTLKADISESRNGDMATWERYRQSSVQNNKDRVKPIEQEISHSIGLFQVTGATMTGLDQTDVPFGYNYTFVAPGYAKQAGNLLVVRPRVLGQKSSDLLETKDPRKFPVIFEGPEKDIDTFEFVLPEGYQVDDLPSSVDMDYSFASYHSKTEVTGNTLKYTRTFEIKELNVPLSKMEDLKKFYRGIAGDERNTAVLKPGAAAASN
jgi:hypothetical protein